MDLNLSFSDYKVYLNGIEVPADNITITSTLGQGSAVATFSLHPTESAFDIPIRTIVDITFKSDIYQNTEQSVTSEDTNGFLGKMPEIILFEGEILSKNFIKSRSQNQIQVTASDFRQIFDVPVLYLINFDEATLTTSITAKLEYPGVPLDVDSGLLNPFGWIESKINHAKGNFVIFLNSLISNLNNNFYKSYVDTRKLNKRIVGSLGSVVIDFLNQKEVQDFMFGQMSGDSQGMSGAYSINTILNMMMSSITGTAIVDTYTNITPPPPDMGFLKSFIVTPRLLGVVPPICNVFFPELIGNISAMDNIKFTRGVMEWDPLGTGDKLSQFQDWAPDELKNKIKVYKEAHKKDKNPPKLQNILQSQMTAEESTTGIFPSIIQVAGYLGKKSKNELCKYAFANNRYSQNFASLGDCPFNPFPVVGLPAVVYMPSSNFSGIGILSSITHTLNSNGQSSNFGITHFTPRKELTMLEGLTTKGGFLSDFTPSKMATIYNYLIGQSVSYNYGDIDLLDFFVGLDGFYTDIVSSSNSFKHAMNTVNRKIATKDDIQKFRDINAYGTIGTMKVRTYVEECRQFTGKK